MFRLNKEYYATWRKYYLITQVTVFLLLLTHISPVIIYSVNFKLTHVLVRDFFRAQAFFTKILALQLDCFSWKDSVISFLCLFFPAIRRYKKIHVFENSIVFHHKATF